MGTVHRSQARRRSTPQCETFRLRVPRSFGWLTPFRFTLLFWLLWFFILFQLSWNTRCVLLLPTFGQWQTIYTQTVRKLTWMFTKHPRNRKCPWMVEHNLLCYSSAKQSFVRARNKNAKLVRIREDNLDGFGLRFLSVITVIRGLKLKTQLKNI